MDWPELSWDVPPQRREWLSKRVRQLGDLTCRFDAAARELIESGELSEIDVEETLAAFRYQASLVYVYLQLEVENATPAADEIPVHAEELKKTERRLRELRQVLLEAIPKETAEKLAIAEAAQSTPDASALMKEAGIQPTWPPPELKVDMLPKKLP